MREKLRRIRAVFEFEFDVSFSFLSAEMMLVILGVFTIMSITIMQATYIHFMITDSSWFNSYQYEEIIWKVTHMDFFLLTSTFYNLTFILIIVVPMLCAFKVAALIDSGMLKAMLSYPIRRQELLILKGIQILLLICIPTTLGALATMALYYGVSIGFDSLSIIISFWVVAFTILSSSFLLSVMMKNAATTAFGGIALWVVLLLVAINGHIPVVFRGISIPVFLVISYFSPSGYRPFDYITEPILSDVLISIVGNLLIGIIMFVASISYFKKTEI